MTYTKGTVIALGGACVETTSCSVHRNCLYQDDRSKCIQEQKEQVVHSTQHHKMVVNCCVSILFSCLLHLYKHKPQLLYFPSILILHISSIHTTHHYVACHIHIQLFVIIHKPLFDILYVLTELIYCLSSILQYRNVNDNSNMKLFAGMLLSCVICHFEMSWQAEHNFFNTSTHITIFECILVHIYPHMQCILLLTHHHQILAKNMSPCRSYHYVVCSVVNIACIRVHRRWFYR